MKRTGSYYDVRSFDDTHGLVIRKKDSFESTVESIEDVVERAKAQGYDNDEKWLIIRVDWEKTFDEQGIFQKETTTRTAVGRDLCFLPGSSLTSLSIVRLLLNLL